MSSEVNLNMEIRKLGLTELYKLGAILNTSDCWKKLMAIVLKQDNLPKFTSEHISMIEQAARHGKRNAAEIFLDEWGTMGKKRPTLETLLECLVKAELFRAADYVACDILKQEAPKRPDYGPAAVIDISDIAINKLLEGRRLHEDHLFDESVISGLILEPKVNSTACPYNERIHDHNTNSLRATDNSVICEEVTNIISPKIVSDLMKFSVTGTCDAANKYVTKSNSSLESTDLLCNYVDANDRTNASAQPTGTPGQHYKYVELPSQELPVFLNNP